MSVDKMTVDKMYFSAFVANPFDLAFLISFTLKQTRPSRYVKQGRALSSFIINVLQDNIDEMSVDKISHLCKKIIALKFHSHLIHSDFKKTKTLQPRRKSS